MKRYEINKTIRTILGVSCEELASRVEVTKQTISNYEIGKNVNKPTQRVLEEELDIFIDKCNDKEKQIVCLHLKEMRAV